MKIRTNIHAAKIDREGGAFNAGLIQQISLISVGQALGHNIWIDEVFLNQLNEAIALKETGLKSKYMHASIISDSIGTLIGKVVNPRIIDNKLAGDLSFAKSSTKSRYGDLADYVMTLAQQTPDFFGASLQFDLDVTTMQVLVQVAGGTLRVQDGQFITQNFKSPDIRNVNNYPHARLSAVNALAIVDEPAANPQGIFAVNFSKINEQIAIIANIIKAQLSGKKQYGLLKELSKMNVEIKEKEEQVKQEAPEVKQEAPAVEQVKQEAPVVEQAKQEAPVVQQEAPVIKQEAPEVKQEAPVEEQEENKQKQSQPTAEVLQAMLSKIEALQIKLQKNDELMKFAKGASPVAPSKADEVKLSMRQNVKQQLKKMRI